MSCQSPWKKQTIALQIWLVSEHLRTAMQHSWSTTPPCVRGRKNIHWHFIKDMESLMMSVLTGRELLESVDTVELHNKHHHWINWTWVDPWLGTGSIQKAFQKTNKKLNHYHCIEASSFLTWSWHMGNNTSASMTDRLVVDRLGSLHCLKHWPLQIWSVRLLQVTLRCGTWQLV